MKLYRTRPAVVEAEMFDGTFASAASIQDWCKGFGVMVTRGGRYALANFVIKTPSGEVKVEPGGYVVHQVDGSYEVLSAAEFGATYEPVLEL